MPTHLERYLLGEEDIDDRPLPELVIEHLGGTMMYQDMPDERRLYRVVDWVYEVTGSRSMQRHSSWKDLKRTIVRHNDLEINQIIQRLKIRTAGGLQWTDFVDIEGLYVITQRMSDRSPMVRLIKRYFAEDGIRIEDVLRGCDAFSKRGVVGTVEEDIIHPKVMQFLRQEGWQTKHHVNLSSGKIIDIVATKPDIAAYIVECKRKLSASTLFQGIGQVLCYCAEYGRQAIPVLACPSGKVSPYAYRSCAKLGIEIIEV